MCGAALVPVTCVTVNLALTMLPQYVKAIIQLPPSLRSQVIYATRPNPDLNGLYLGNLYTRNTVGDKKFTNLAKRALETCTPAVVSSWIKRVEDSELDKFLNNPVIAMCVFLRTACDKLELGWHWNSGCAASPRTGYLFVSTVGDSTAY